MIKSSLHRKGFLERAGNNRRLGGRDGDGDDDDDDDGQNDDGDDGGGDDGDDGDGGDGGGDGPSHPGQCSGSSSKIGFKLIPALDQFNSNVKMISYIALEPQTI